MRDIPRQSPLQVDQGRLLWDQMRWEIHDDVVKWKLFPRYWPFVRGTTGHWWVPLTKASDADLWYILWSASTNGWANNRDAGDLRRHRARYDVTIMTLRTTWREDRQAIEWTSFAFSQTDGNMQQISNNRQNTIFHQNHYHQNTYMCKSSHFGNWTTYSHHHMSLDIYDDCM